MTTDPRNVQGSDADRAEGGLDVEAEYAELDGPTANRLAREAEAHAEQTGRRGRVTGTPAMDMLTSPVEGGLQDEANVDGEFRYEGPQG